MSYIGLITAILYLLAGIPMLVLQGWAFRSPTGLWVHLLRSGVSAYRSPGIQPLLVQIKASHALYVDWRPVSLADLGPVLRRELPLRPPNWPVYVEGDPSLDWMHVAQAVDIIRGEHAEVILLATPEPAGPKFRDGR
jgi:biopolymer transport protein ExbD